MKDYFNGKTDDDKKTIHLFMTETCTHHCKFCCNREYSTSDIPVVTVDEMRNAQKICLTGGEPFLISSVCDFAKRIKQQFPNIQMIYVYTCGDSLYEWLDKYNELHDIDGVNISPKNKHDIECLNAIFANKDYRNQIISMWSNRIYLFPNVRDYFEHHDLSQYESIKIINREWQEDFEPASGIFRRLPILF